MKMVEGVCDLRVLAAIKREEKALKVMEGACNLVVEDTRQRGKRLLCGS